MKSEGTKHAEMGNGRQEFSFPGEKGSHWFDWAQRSSIVIVRRRDLGDRWRSSGRRLTEEMEWKIDKSNN
jgi:hypothetical protein